MTGPEAGRPWTKLESRELENRKNENIRGQRKRNGDEMVFGKVQDEDVDVDKARTRESTRHPQQHLEM